MEKEENNMKIEMQGTKHPNLTEEEIVNVEKKLGVLFPLEYKDFLLSQNGGYPKACEFDLPDGSNASIVNHFYSIGEMSSNLYKRNRFLEDSAEFINIGDDSGGNQILLRVRGENAGELYFLDHDIDPEEENNMHFLAKNLNEFLKMLK